MTEAKGGDIRSAADVLSCFPTLISFLGDLHQKIACADLSISMQVTEVAEACFAGKKKKSSFTWRRPPGPETPPWDRVHVAQEWLYRYRKS